MNDSRPSHGGKDRGGGAQRLQPLTGLGPGLGGAQETRTSGASKKEHAIRGKLEEIEMMRKALVAKKEALHDESYPLSECSSINFITNAHARDNSSCQIHIVITQPLTHTYRTTPITIASDPLFSTPYPSLTTSPTATSRRQHPPSLLFFFLH